MNHVDHAAEVRRALNDPRRLVERLSLSKGSRPQGGGGITVLCPVHGDRTASCSVTRGPDGTVRAKCFSCDFSADALGLVAAVYRLDTRSDFLEVLKVAADIAGLHQIVDELATGKALPQRPELPEVKPTAPAEYPDLAEVIELWETCEPVNVNAAASACLVSRRIDPDAVAKQHLARAMNDRTVIQSWARYQARQWNHTGHRMLLPVYDCKGAFRSIRAWRIIDGDSPKRLPPTGRKASELILANTHAIGLLRSNETRPAKIVIVEGEPDFLVMSTRCTLPVFGVLSGSWTTEFARRISRGSEVCISTHNDEAGERYAKQIAETLTDKCILWRQLP